MKFSQATNAIARMRITMVTAVRAPPLFVGGATAFAESTRRTPDRTGEESTKVRGLGKSEPSADLRHRNVALGQQPLRLQRHAIVKQLLGGAAGGGDTGASQRP